MDDDENITLDFNSPVGKLLKQLETKSKKTEVDESLSEILDKFSSFISEQDKYLENGIFKMNFAENALFLQSCTQLYSKRIDKLWDETMEVHTRLVQQDHARNINRDEKREQRQIELKKLEERLNKYKRKKVQLTAENEEVGTSCNVFNLRGEIYDICEDEADKYKDLPYEPDEDLIKNWYVFEQVKEKKYARVAWLHALQQLRLRNYTIAGNDPEIYDMKDKEEFNSRYSRVPSYHHIRHLLEYNDKCFLPDSENVIAQLRISYIVRQKYMLDNKIPYGTRFEVYKEGFEDFVKLYYEKEHKKIQNLPQRTAEDVLNLYKILSKREEQALFARSKLGFPANQISPSITFESLIEAPLSEAYQDNDVSLHRSQSVECKKLITTDELTNKDNQTGIGAGSKSSKLTVDIKLRSDSGYFDCGFETDSEDEDGNSTQKQNNNTETLDKNNSKSNSENNANDTDTSKGDVSENINAESIGSKEPTCEKENDVADQHEFTNTSAQIEQLVDEIITNSSDSNKEILSNTKENELLRRSKRELKGVRKIPEFLFYGPKLNFKQSPEVQEPKQTTKRENISPEESVPFKKRRLTQKQVEKLKRSLINPVKELKWERFFSMHYKPEDGEGIIQLIDYESDPEIYEDYVATSEECHDISYSTCVSGSMTNISDHDNCDPDSTFESSEHTDHNALDDSGVDMDMSCLPTDDEGHQNGDSGVFSGEANEEVISKIENGWNNIIREHMTAPLTSRASNNEFPTKENENEIETKQMRERVTQWKNYMSKKLKTLTEHDFDIHEYGSRIMDSMELHETKSFANVVENKSTAEVVKYFISSLQLANTHNVSICGIKSGELSHDTLCLRLLNRNKHHEDLAKYQAPSEETFGDKLEKVKAMKKRDKVQPGLIKEKTRNTYSSNVAKTQSMTEYKNNKTLSSWKGKNTILPKKKIMEDGESSPPEKRQRIFNFDISSERRSWNYQQPSTSTQANLIDQMMSPVHEDCRLSSNLLNAVHSVETNNSMTVTSMSENTSSENLLNSWNRHFDSTPT